MIEKIDQPTSLIMNKVPPPPKPRPHAPEKHKSKSNPLAALDLAKDRRTPHGLMVGHKLAVPTKEGWHYVNHDDLDALEADGSYTWVCLGSGDRLLVSRNLGSIEANLPHPPFFRCHRAAVINLSKVVDVFSLGGYRVLLRNGSKVIVARSHWSSLLAAMKKI